MTRKITELLEEEAKIKNISPSRYEEYLQSEAWKVKRKNLIKTLGDKCFYCGSKKNINVHHKNYNNVGFETTNNVIIVCSKCHKEIHGKEKTPIGGRN